MVIYANYLIFILMNIIENTKINENFRKIKGMNLQNYSYFSCFLHESTNLDIKVMLVLLPYGRL